MENPIQGRIREHQEVRANSSVQDRGAAGAVQVGTVQVGTVDHLEGNYIKLTRKDSPSGQHRWIPLRWVENIEGEAVYLNKNEDEFRQGAMTQNPEAQNPEGHASESVEPDIAGGTGTSPDLLGDTRDTTSRTSLLSDPSRLPSIAGGTVSGAPSGMSAPHDRPEPELSGAGAPSAEGALSSAGGPRLSDAEIRESGREDVQVPDVHVPVPNRDGVTDQYVARGSGGVGGTTEDLLLRSGAGGQAGSWDDRNANSGAAGNVSAPDGLPGQGDGDA